MRRDLNQFRLWLIGCLVVGGVGISHPAFANFFDTVQVAGSGMDAQRERMDVIATNIANSETVKTTTGEPYRRKIVTLVQGQRLGAGSGVRVQKVTQDASPYKQIYDPSNPYADAKGYVTLPNVDSTKEMVDMMSATRAFEANVQAFNAAKSMAQKALTIGR